MLERTTHHTTSVVHPGFSGNVQFFAAATAAFAIFAPLLVRLFVTATNTMYYFMTGVVHNCEQILRYNNNKSSFLNIPRGGVYFLDLFVLFRDAHPRFV